VIVIVSWACFRWSGTAAARWLAPPVDLASRQTGFLVLRDGSPERPRHRETPLPAAEAGSPATGGDGAAGPPGTGAVGDPFGAATPEVVVVLPGVPPEFEVVEVPLLVPGGVWELSGWQAASVRQLVARRRGMRRMLLPSQWRRAGGRRVNRVCKKGALPPRVRLCARDAWEWRLPPHAASYRDTHDIDHACATHECPPTPHAVAPARMTPWPPSLRRAGARSATA
jgi:hypothetical protein